MASTLQHVGVADGNQATGFSGGDINAPEFMQLTFTAVKIMQAYAKFMKYATEEMMAKATTSERQWSELG